MSPTWLTTIKVNLGLKLPTIFSSLWRGRPLTGSNTICNFSLSWKVAINLLIPLLPLLVKYFNACF